MILFRSPVTRPLFGPGGTDPTGKIAGRVRRLGDPDSYEVTSGFGARDLTLADGTRLRDFHAGLDVGSGHGGGVLVATAPGRVIASGWLGQPWSDGYGGNMVVIDHGDEVISLYAHMQPVVAPVGTVVTPGQPIGNIGRSSINTSIPDHLHFAIRAPMGANVAQESAGWVDPWPLILGTPLIIGEDMAWHAEIVPYRSGRRVTLRPEKGGQYEGMIASRTAPYLNAPSSPAGPLPGGGQVTLIGEVTGDAFAGSRKWYVYVRKGQGIECFHSTGFGADVPTMTPAPVDCAEIVDEATRPLRNQIDQIRSIIG